MWGRLAAQCHLLWDSAFMWGGPLVRAGPPGPASSHRIHLVAVGREDLTDRRFTADTLRKEHTNASFPGHRPTNILTRATAKITLKGFLNSA
ncbi:hypothetical protein SBA4_800010 [Candidatus Sulfopaludibacter sp. SbA4]|nr:hypothetical protein SBA4_800010 [Candidatus Sulfopaludibacter sp. SbA4]